MKLDKKKKREKRVKEQLKKVRMARIKSNKKDRLLKEEEIRANEIKQEPFVKPIDSSVIEAEREKIKQQLETNRNILKALEEDFKKEIEGRKEIYESLEREGHITPEQKFEAIKKRAKEQIEKITNENT